MSNRKERGSQWIDNNGRLDDRRSLAVILSNNQTVVDALTAALSQEGMEVCAASSIEQALATLRSIKPRVALVERSPMSDGSLTLVRRIRENEQTGDIPIILIGKCVEEGEIVEYLAAGISSYIEDPFDALTVCLRVRNQLRLSESLQRLRQRERELSVINEAAKDAIITIDNEGNVSHWNPAATNIFGYKYEEAIGRNAHELSAPPRFRDAFKKAFPRFQATGEGNAVGKTLELVALRKDGNEFPIEISLAATTVDGKWCAVAIIRDITERKATEIKLEEERTNRQRVELELRHAQKLEAVGQLAAGIAHEINTPIQYVGDSLYFLKDTYEQLKELIAKYRDAIAALGSTSDRGDILRTLRDAEEHADFEYTISQAPAAFERCFDGISRVSSIVGAMKEFAHPDQREKSPADLNQALKNTLTIARNEYKYVADVETALGEIPVVMCYLGDLNQVFLNLIVNAAHAIADAVRDSGQKGRIWVRSMREDDCVRIEVEDTGTGIPEAIRGRVFEPFFTTKAVGKGTGQGLPIARSIVVDKHGGSLTFQSEVGKGTTFIVRLPLQR
jgi:two-component system NtrC family sensor kinase